MKKLLVVGVIVIFLGLAIAPSTGTIRENPIDPNNIAPCFLVGIMHERIVKIPWGYKSLWRPICVIRIGGTNGRRFLGPFSGIIEPGYYNYTGYVGELRFIRHPSGEGFFFICAGLTPFNS